MYFLVKNIISTSCYLGSGVSHLGNSVCLMVVTYLHTICNLKVVHLFKCIFNLGPHAVMLRAPRHLNPALRKVMSKTRDLEI